MGSNKYCVIIAGGVGPQFWPKSRQALPKQFLDMLGSGKSFIRHTFERFLPLVPVENFVIVTGKCYRDLVLEHIPELTPEQVLCEPINRNTTPSVCYAAYSLLKRDPEAEMIVTPADHFVSDEEGLRSIVGECFDFVSQNEVLMTVGVRPTRPETLFGYIQVSDRSDISRVKSFVEKPNLELAQTFLQCGEFFWNSGIFVWRAVDILKAVEQHLPECYALFDSVKDVYGTAEEERAIYKVYSECRSISVAFGVMERADNVYVRVGEFGWSNVGTWGSVHQLSPKDKYDNTANENVMVYDTHNCILSLPEDKVVVVSGLSDYIVVDTEDALMICPRSQEQEIRKFVEDVRYNNSNKKGDKLI